MKIGGKPKNTFLGDKPHLKGEKKKGGRGFFFGSEKLAEKGKKRWVFVSRVKGGGKETTGAAVKRRRNETKFAVVPKNYLLKGPRTKFGKGEKPKLWFWRGLGETRAQNWFFWGFWRGK